MNTKAVYAASFDPITFGHLNVIERTARLYDNLVVVVANNSQKQYTFDAEVRASLIATSIEHLDNVSVEICTDRYIVKYAESIGAQVVIRGLRNSQDLQDEQSLAEANHKICPTIETIFVPCRPELMYVSSSLVKGHVGVDPEWEEQVRLLVPPAVLKKLKDGIVYKQAKRHWNKLMVMIGKPPQGESVFNLLVARYSEPHRAYHVLNHIVSMLNELEKIDKYTVPLATAIWFHDVIYDPQSSNNELRSAELAEEVVINRLIQERALGEQIYNLIVTTTHQASITVWDEEAMILHDLDLMILGATSLEFDTYESGIRFEYKHVSDDDFKSERTEILKKFLGRQTVFLTNHFIKRFESSARANLKRSLAQLQQ